LKMLAEQLAQTVCGLEILRRLDWEVECRPAGVVGLDFVFKTFLGKLPKIPKKINLSFLAPATHIPRWKRLRA
jgi:hypothetical protein